MVTLPEDRFSFAPPFALPYDPAEPKISTKLLSSFLVTILIAPRSDDVPYTLAAGPSRISILSISLISTGRSTAL